MWPPEDAIAITLRVRDDEGISYITTASARELIARLRELQTAMGSAQFVASEIERQLATPPADGTTLALFDAQAETVISAIDASELDAPLPDDIDKLRTALTSSD